MKTKSREIEATNPELYLFFCANRSVSAGLESQLADLQAGDL